jgi:peptidoglycan hydrolase-like protein with peptidoglycan-binding domain
MTTPGGGTFMTRDDKHDGLWSELRKAAGLTANKAPVNEDGYEFVYVLLTGREARLINSSTKNSLTRLRFGSVGVDVEALQLNLSLIKRKSDPTKTYYTANQDGKFGVSTARAYVAWQQEGEGFADDIVTPLDARSLGFDIIKHQSLSKREWNPRLLYYEDPNLKPSNSPKDKATPTKAKAQDAEKYYTAKAGTHYDVRPDILVTAKLEEKMEELAKKVYDDTKPNHKITYSSGYRGPDRQAKAMYDKLVKDSKALDIYKAKEMAAEIKKAYDDNKSKGETETVKKMIEVIEKQVAAGKYISNHMVSGAVDVSSVDKSHYDKIRKFVKEMGYKEPLDEGDHLHVQF